MFAAAFVLLAASVPVALSVTLAPAGAAEGAAGSDALADLEQRSPGERLVGIAVKAAKAVSRALGAGPAVPADIPTAQRAIARTGAPPTSEEVVFALQDPVAPPLAVVIPDQPGLPSGTGPFAGPIGGGSSGGFAFVPVTSSGGGTSSGGITSSGGGSTSSGGITSSGGTSTSGGTTTSSSGGDTPVTPVPEPGTWALMILGFGLVGSAMRRQPRAVRQSRRI